MKGGKNTHETADFTNHLEEFEKMVAIDLFNVYECMNCDCRFAVSQAVEDHSSIICPSCTCDDSIEDISSGTMTIQL